MLTKELRNDIDKLWEKFWTGGITNPLTVIEQISYLLYARLLDMQETIQERKALRTKKPFTRLFPDTPEGQLLRWKNFSNLPGPELLKHLKDNVYPHFQDMHFTGSDISDFMADADIEIKNAAVLVSAVQMVDKLPLGKQDVKGDLYEYLLSKLTTAGINGQFRTPRHIIDMMVAMMEPSPTDKICDPSCGTAGFLARTMEYITRVNSNEDGTFEDEDGNKHYSGNLLSEEERSHLKQHSFWGFDFDTTMLRVASMNMLLHGIDGANIHYQDTLNKSIKENWSAQEEDYFDLILANPPFKGSLDESGANPSLLKMVKTKKTELLFVAHILRSLKLGGRSATIVPDGVLFGSSGAHKKLREKLITENQLEGIVSLPSGVFKPYAGVSTAIMIFAKGGTTDQVWFYDVQADGFSLDDKRNEIEQNDIPSVLEKWKEYSELRLKNKATDVFEDRKQACFVVPAQEIIDNKYDLSVNRYKEVVYEEESFDPPREILDQLLKLEDEIKASLTKLKGMI